MRATKKMGRHLENIRTALSIYYQEDRALSPIQQLNIKYGNGYPDVFNMTPTDIDIAIDRLFMKFYPRIRRYDNRKDTVYVVTSKDGKEELVYIANHFGKTNFYWAREAVKKELGNYEFKYAIEMLDSRYEQALMMSMFETVKNSLKHEGEIRLDLFYFTREQIKFNERKFGKYMSIANSTVEYINNQIKLYELLSPLGVALAKEGVDNL